MKSLKLLVFPFLFLCVLVIQSCEREQSLFDTEKLEEEQDCFFTNDCLAFSKSKSAKELSPFTETIITYFKDHPGEKKSIESSVGIPYWEHSVDWSRDTESILYIPLIKNDKVNGFLIAFQNEGMAKPKFKAIKLSKATKLKKKGNETGKLKYIDQEHAIITFLWFQNEIEGSLDCKLVNAYKKLQGKSMSDAKSCHWSYTASWNCYNELYEGGGGAAVCAREWEYEFICGDEEAAGGSEDDGGSGTGDPNSGDGDTGSSTTNNNDPPAEDCDPGYVKDANGNCVEEECEEGFVKDANGECVEEDVFPIYAPDCEVFQWDQKFGNTGAPYNVSCINNLSITFVYHKITLGATGTVHTETGYYTLNWQGSVYFEIPGRYDYDQSAFLASNSIEEANAWLQLYKWNPDDSNWAEFEAAMQAHAEQQIRESLSNYGGRFNLHNDYNVSNCNEYETITIAEEYFKCPNYPYLN